MKLTGNIYLTSRFFMLGGGVAALFFLSYGITFLLFPTIMLAFILVGVTFYDIFILHSGKRQVSGKRIVAPVWSIGSDSIVKYLVRNESNITLNISLTDELPEQFQVRDHQIRILLAPGKDHEKSEILRPLTRGRYCFGHTRAFIATKLQLCERRLSIAAEAQIQVYPSIEQMKKLELSNFSKVTFSNGIKKIRRLGNTQEFEQIKTYAIGDDQRRINWKSTGKRAEIMVNQYQEERSQQVYCIIDKSRVMDFVSNGLSLLDHSINTALVISNIALQKQDKAGLITYSSRPNTFVKADRKGGQLKLILENLYREKESQTESNIELLYHLIRKNITQRSLLLFFTNFESLFALERSLPVLRSLNRSHVVVVLFFENEEIRDYAAKEPVNISEVYDQVIAEKYLYEKRQIMMRMRNYGIHAIVTRPDQLALTAINKYLELKSRGII